MLHQLMVALLVAVLTVLTTAAVRGAVRPRWTSTRQSASATKLYSTAAAADSSSISDSSSVFTPDDVFWITPDGLTMELLVSFAASNPKGRPLPSYVLSKSTAGNASDPSLLRSTFLKLSQFFVANEAKSNERPPLLFVHGSFHSAWCFAEHYMGYFNSLGYDCYSVSLRGTAATGMPMDAPGETVKVEEHVRDLSFAVRTIVEQQTERKRVMKETGRLPGEAFFQGTKAISGSRVDQEQIQNETDEIDYNQISRGVKPVLVAHSFGGLIAMKLLEDGKIRRLLSGVAVMCSVPPSGNGPMTKRFIQFKFINSLKIVFGFVFKGATFIMNLCRELFFDETFEPRDVKRYMDKFAEDSRVGLDLVSLACTLPSKTSMDPLTGKATWLLSQSSSNSEMSEPSDASIATASNRSDSANQVYEARYLPSLSGTHASEVSVPRRLVIGAEKDFLVDLQGVKETGTYFGVSSAGGGLTREVAVSRRSKDSLILNSRRIARKSALPKVEKVFDREIIPPTQLSVDLISTKNQTAYNWWNKLLTRSFEEKTSQVVNKTTNNSTAGQTSSWSISKLVSWLTTSPTVEESIWNSSTQTGASSSWLRWGSIPMVVDTSSVSRNSSTKGDRIVKGKSNLFSTVNVTAYGDPSDDAQLVLLPNLYHDVMLGPKWELGAAVIADWLATSVEA